MAGAVLPFLILGGVIWVESGGSPSMEALLGHGDLFIPSSIMNAEALWFFGVVALSRKKLWYPCIVLACGGAALGGAIFFGVATALEAASPHRVTVSSATAHQLTQVATWLSGGEFLEALVLGGLGVALFTRYGRKEESGS